MYVYLSIYTYVCEELVVCLKPCQRPCNETLATGKCRPRVHISRHSRQPCCAAAAGSSVSIVRPSTRFHQHRKWFADRWPNQQRQQSTNCYQLLDANSSATVASFVQPPVAFGSVADRISAATRVAREGRCMKPRCDAEGADNVKNARRSITRDASLRARAHSSSSFSDTRVQRQCYGLIYGCLRAVRSVDVAASARSVFLFSGRRPKCVSTRTTTGRRNKEDDTSMVSGAYFTVARSVWNC